MEEEPPTPAEIAQQLAMYRQLHQQRYTAQQPVEPEQHPMDVDGNEPTQPPSGPSQSPSPIDPNTESHTPAISQGAPKIDHIGQSFSPASPPSPSPMSSSAISPPSSNAGRAPPSEDARQNRLACGGSWTMLDSIYNTDDAEPSAPRASTSSASAPAQESQQESSPSIWDMVRSVAGQAIEFLSSSSSSSSSRPNQPSSSSRPMYEMDEEESDEALARRLQEEEERLAYWNQQQELPAQSNVFRERLISDWGDGYGGHHPNLEDDDEALAYQIHIEEMERARRYDQQQGHHQQIPDNAGSGDYCDEDEEIARHLQEEEEQAARVREQQEREARRFQEQQVPPHLRALMASMRGGRLPEERNQRQVDPNALLFWPLLGPNTDPLAAARFLHLMNNPDQYRQDNLDNMSYEELLRLEEQLGIISRGATTEQIDNLPTTVAQAKAGGEGLGTCAVCLEQFEAGQPLRTLPCLHQFHQECVDKWLGMNRCCPVCKTDIC